MHLLTMLDRPSLANIRGVDFVRLIATGGIFGAAIVILVQYFVDRRSS